VRVPKVRTVAACAALSTVTLLTAIPAAAAPPDSSSPPTTPDDADADAATSQEVPAAPALNPGIGVGTTAFERQLAEIGFATFVTVELGLDVGRYACTEPRSVEPPSPIECFTIIDGERVIVAETEASDGTGRFSFDVVSDQDVGGHSDADAAVVDYGEEINRVADEYTDDYLAADPRITAISTFHFDPDTAVLTLELTVADGVEFPPEVVAWVNTREFARAHWKPGSPWRAEEARLQPAFTIVVNGERFVSDFDVMVDVADEDISEQAWVAVAAR